MDYAFRYYKGINKDLENVKEVIIKYTEKDPSLIKFVEDSKYKVVADVTNCKNLKDSLGIFAGAARTLNFFTLKINISQREIIPDLQKDNIDFFFAEGADTWDKLLSFIQAGVSEVYIINELAFDIVRVSDVCRNYSVKIRMYPNVAQTSAEVKDYLDTFKFFYIRPEDLYLYEEYVNTLEFFGPIDRQEVLYRIYEVNKEWVDDLSILIIGLNKYVFNGAINPSLGRRRLNCKKKCAAGECIACDNAAHTAEKLAEMNLYFKEVDDEK